MNRRRALDRETLDEQEILRVTGLPRARQLETLPIPASPDGEATGRVIAGARSDRDGLRGERRCLAS